MTRSHETADGPYQDFNDRVRLALLDKLSVDYAAEPGRHQRAAAQTQIVALRIHAAFPGGEEVTPEDQLLEGALTKLFFAFSNPDAPDDTSATDRILDLCVDVFNSQPSTLNFPERLDVAASYLYAYNSEVFIGPWQPGTSSAERFDAAFERMCAGFESQ